MMNNEAKLISVVWDKQLLLNRIMHNHELFITLLQVFLEDIPQLTYKLNEAFVSCDYSKITNLAHDLKGTAYNVTAEPLGDIAMQIEAASKRGDIDFIRKVWSELNLQLELTIAAFSEELAKQSL